MGFQNNLRDRLQFDYLNYRLKTGLLLLAGFVVLSSIIMAWIIFSVLINFALNPEHARSLVDQWAALFLDQNPTGPLSGLSPFNGPARWFALIVLVILAYLISRMPLVLLQMGTQLLLACQDDQRGLRLVLREVLAEVKAMGGQEKPDTPPPPSKPDEPIGQ